MSYTVHTVDTAPTAARDTLAQVAKAYGFLPNLMAVMAEAPALLEAYPAMIGLFNQTSLTPAERQLVLLTTSVENGCRYCVAAHTVIAAMQQVPNDVVRAIRNDQPILDVRLEAVRRLTSRIVAARGHLTPAETAAFLSAGYTQAQILEVVLGVGVKTLSNYANHVAETPLDAAFAHAAWTAAATTPASR
ncbi:MAG: carboxymuconolactone decarboxylase family protein [Acidobacteria bacterium]|nr:MAG: carboxymuconolactone decarboxylase family protein [Acidobacteriota bacterium]